MILILPAHHQTLTQQLHHHCQCSYLSRIPSIMPDDTSHSDDGACTDDNDDTFDTDRFFMGPSSINSLTSEPTLPVICPFCIST